MTMSQDATALDVLRAESDIRKLLAEYAHSCDDHRAGDFGALFSEDAVYVVTGEAYGQVRRGRAEIIEHIATYREGYTPHKHVLSGERIDVAADGRSARAAVDFHHLWGEGDGHVIGGVGRYYIRLDLRDVGWQIVHQAVVFRGDPAPDDA